MPEAFALTLDWHGGEHGAVRCPCPRAGGCGKSIRIPEAFISVFVGTHPVGAPCSLGKRRNTPGKTPVESPVLAGDTGSTPKSSPTGQSSASVNCRWSRLCGCAVWGFRQDGGLASGAGPCCTYCRELRPHLGPQVGWGTQSREPQVGRAGSRHPPRQHLVTPPMPPARASSHAASHSQQLGEDSTDPSGDVGTATGQRRCCAVTGARLQAGWARPPGAQGSLFTPIFLLQRGNSLRRGGCDWPHSQ